MLGRATAFWSGDFDAAREMVDRAVGFNPNSFRAWQQRGWTCVTAGQPEEAIRSFERAIRLSPFDPSLFITFIGMSVAYIGLGRFDEAVSAAKKSLRAKQTNWPAHPRLPPSLSHSEHKKKPTAAPAGLPDSEPSFPI